MVDLTQTTLGWVQGLLLPVPCELGAFSELTDSAQLQPAPTQAVVSRYLSGGGIFQYGYEVYLRTLPYDTQGRLDAMATLNKVASAIVGKDYPDAPEGVIWYGHELTSRPSKVDTDEAGRETWQLVAIITYIERG